MVFLYSWGHFKADGAMGKINTYVYVLISINTFKCFYEGNMFGNQKKRYTFNVKRTSQYERCPEI